MQPGQSEHTQSQLAVTVGMAMRSVCSMSQKAVLNLQCADAVGPAAELRVGRVQATAVDAILCSAC